MLGRANGECKGNDHTQGRTWRPSNQANTESNVLSQTIECGGQDGWSMVTP